MGAGGDESPRSGGGVEKQDADICKYYCLFHVVWHDRHTSDVLFLAIFLLKYKLKNNNQSYQS
jgi:hypothetical protein